MQYFRKKGCTRSWYALGVRDSEPDFRLCTDQFAQSRRARICSVRTIEADRVRQRAESDKS